MLSSSASPRKIRSIAGVRVRGKRVLVRIDGDVDLDEQGNIEPGGDHRVIGCLPTLVALRESGARLILLAHLGRPGGTVVEKYRMAKVWKIVAQALQVPERFQEVVVGPVVRDAALALRDGEVLFLENLRFDPREEANDPAFARALAELGELYVNEAFAVAHRAHASVAAITDYLPSYAGMLFAREVTVLQTITEHPRLPLVALVSGAKIETKISLLRHLLPRVEFLLTGGGVANMFLRLQGFPLGASLVEPHLDDAVRELWTEFEKQIVLPTDTRVFHPGAAGPLTVSVDEIGDADRVYDIGPQTIARYCGVVGGAGTCIWNGPLGKVEEPGFAEGTRAFARCAAKSGAYTVVGGGDTVTALRQMGLTDTFDHVSTGGGAMIAFLEGEPLPAVDAVTE